MAKNDPVEALLLEAHKAIHDSVSSTIESLKKLDLVYPPNSNFSEEEKKALDELKLSSAAISALQKILLDACSYPCFHLFSLLDGVSDPEVQEIGEWYGLSFCKKKENEEMLHDRFFDTYSKYVKLTSEIK